MNPKNRESFIADKSVKSIGDERKEVYWSRFADNFAESSSYVVGRKDMQTILSAVSLIKELGHTLELACGNGTYSAVLAPNAIKLVATDFSDKMVNASKERLKAYRNILVEKADGFSLPFKDEIFDTVFMANLLHVIDGPEAVIAQACRVLKRGGRIVTLDLTMTGMRFFHKAGMVYRYFKTYGKPPLSSRNLSPSQIHYMLAENGLIVEHSELIGLKSKAAFIIGKKIAGK